MLLKNLKVRTKIVAVLVPLVVVMAVTTVIAVRGRLAEANRADEQHELAEVARAGVGLADTVADESLAALLAVSGGDAQAFQEAVEATAPHREVFMAGLELLRDSDDPFLSTRLDRAERALNDLAALRMTASGGFAGAQDVVDGYTSVLTGIEDLVSTIGPRIRVGGAYLDIATAELAAHNSVAELALQVVSNNALPVLERNPEATVAALRRVQAMAEQLEDLAAEESVGQLGQLQASEAVALLEEAVESVLAGETVELRPLIDGVREQSQLLADAAIAEFQAQLATVADAADDERNEARTFTVVSLVALVIAVVGALFVTRSITRPLEALTSTTYEIATERLPRLVDRLRSPDSGPLAAELQPIEIDTRDEIGQLAAAFNTMQKVTGEVAEQQAAMLRKGISDIFVNLARRNQSLLDRQIEFIDQLEAKEQDPDQLDNLFRLDHLATRMRRNAESLLVLAGAEPARRRGRPIPLTDVIRVAIGEVEHYARIGVTGLEDVLIRGNVAVDLAHLLAELMDNATNYSPPDTRVDLAGARVGESSFVITIADRGIGMNDKQLAEANMLLSRPPAVGLDLSRSLGLTVVARLAHRHGIQVRLVRAEQHGIVAQVLLPKPLFDVAPGHPAPPALGPAAAAAVTGSAPTASPQAPAAPAFPAAAPAPAGTAAPVAPVPAPQWEAATTPPPAPAPPAATPAPAGHGAELPMRGARVAAMQAQGFPVPQAPASPQGAEPPAAEATPAAPPHEEEAPARVPVVEPVDAGSEDDEAASSPWDAAVTGGATTGPQQVEEDPLVAPRPERQGDPWAEATVTPADIGVRAHDDRSSTQLAGTHTGEQLNQIEPEPEPGPAEAVASAPVAEPWYPAGVDDPPAAVAAVEPVAAGLLPTEQPPEGAVAAPAPLPSRRRSTERAVEGGPDGAPAGPEGVPGTPGATAAPTNRSPEEVRRMLSRYRSGLKRGQAESESRVDEVAAAVDHPEGGS